MTNVTLAIEEKVLKEARTRALQEGTTVNRLVARYLESYAGFRERQRAATDAFLKIANESTAGHGRRISRDEMHER